MESPPLPSAPAFDNSPARNTDGTVDVTASLAPTFVISVGDPQKVGSSLNVATQHTVYTVRTKVRSLPLTNRSHTDPPRRLPLLRSANPNSPSSADSATSSGCSTPLRLTTPE